MPSNEWIDRVAAIRQYAAHGQRAPHKPLLLLYSIGRLARSGSSRVSFAEAEEPLSRLLSEFGAPGTGETPQYPFRRLENDGLWYVDVAEGADDPGESLTALRASATGQLTAEFERALADPETRSGIVGFILGSHFPPTLHSDLLEAVGLSAEPVAGDPVASKRAPRDPNFRRTVLMAYEYRCAFCGYDGGLDRGAVGLEAAHVRWHAFEGPDSTENGMSLCTMHHKLLDRGVLGLEQDHTIAVSQHFVGRSEASERLVMFLAGTETQAPQPGYPRPAQTHIDWHRSKVFRGPARQAAEPLTTT